MRVSFFCLSALLSIVGCSDDDPGTSTTDTGVATTDTGSGTDTGVTPDTGAADTGNVPDAASDTPAALSCAIYCDTVTDNCTGSKNTQYLDKPRCLSMCANMNLGAAADMMGDTVGCRLYHSRLAKTEGQDLHCPHAGATGGGLCGTRCDAMCKLGAAHCTGKGFPHATEAACKTACAAMTFESSAIGGELDQKKQTLNCVQYHMQAAYKTSGDDATVHCPHLQTTVRGSPCGAAT